MSSSRTTAFCNLAEAIGLEAALVLVAFAGGSTVYAPEKYHVDHLLERVLGETAFLRLVAFAGGETLCLPQAGMEPERRVGAVYRGMRAGLSTRQIADGLGCTYRRVRQIEVAIRNGAPLTALARRGAENA